MSAELLSARMQQSRERLVQIDAELAEGRMTPEAHREERSRLMGDLLGAAEPQAAPATRAPGWRRWAPAVALLLIVAAAGTVLFLKQRDEGSPPPAAQMPGDEAKPAHALTDEQLQRMVEQASEQTKRDPKDVTAWALLAHSYDMLGKFAESTKAYEQLAKLAPKDAQVLADYADALAVAHGRSLDGEPEALVRRALELDPANVKALSLAGTAAFEHKQYDQAVAHWERAKAASKDPRFTQQIDSGIAEARALAKGDAPPAPVAVAASGPAVVSGRVSLADDLAGKAPPDATVFVFARPVQGSRMPVAILRKQVRDLPLDFSLDDTMAMVKEAKLSQTPRVIIGARVSMRGDVMPQAGDMQGFSAPVTVGSTGIHLEISEVLK